MIIQELIFPYIGDMELYFRINNGKIENKEIFLEKNGVLKTNTFFNIFSAGKWFKYTDLQDLSLRLYGNGKVKLSIFQLYNENEKELEVYSKDLELETNPVVELPKNVWQFNNGMIFFALTAYENVVIQKADYITNTSVNTNIVMALNICTYKREEYLKNNITKLEKDILNNPDSFLYNKLEVFIADNGKTLGEGITTDKIHVFPNANTGGSGGFTRGLKEILTVSDEKKITHTIFMDDDIKLIPQVIERTAQFLSFIKDEFADSIIPGAMLKSDSPNVQHEFGGCWQDKIVLLRPGLDTVKIQTLTQNDKENLLINYAGWWYSCFSLKSLKKIGLPLQLFIKGDDIEYSLRLNTDIILLNGIGVWHESFENKYQPINVYYEARNHLIINTLYKPSLKISTLFFGEIFWRTATYRYIDVYIYLKAVRDFCRGADWLLNIDSEKHHAILFNNIKKYFSPVTLENIPDNFTYIKTNTAKIYNKWKSVFTLNGWLLPANKNIALDIGSDAHEMYRVKKAIWYIPQTKQGIIVKKSFCSLCKVAFLTLYTYFVILFRYKKAKKSYRKSFNKLCQKDNINKNQ